MVASLSLATKISMCSNVIRCFNFDQVWCFIFIFFLILLFFHRLPMDLPCHHFLSHLYIVKIIYISSFTSFSSKRVVWLILSFLSKAYNFSNGLNSNLPFKIPLRFYDFLHKWVKCDGLHLATSLQWFQKVWVWRVENLYEHYERHACLPLVASMSCHAW